MSPSSQFLSSATLVEEIHRRARSACAEYRRAESEVIRVLSQIDQHRVYLKRGHSSLFQYVVSELGLSSHVAYTFITVARKTREVPELMTSLEKGELTLTNARRIVPLLDRNSDEKDRREWIQKASDLSTRQLEKEIVRVRPIEETPERAKYVNSSRVQLTLGLSEKEMLRLRRVQDLLCQSKRRPVTLEETIEAMTELFLERKDPLRKAERHQVRKGSSELVSRRVQLEENASDESDSELEGTSSKAQNSSTWLSPQSADDRTPPSTRDSTPQPRGDSSALSADASDIHSRARQRIPSAVIHAVNLRDGRQCAHVGEDGKRCRTTRWIDIHHRHPVHQGGLNTPENLVTLCSAHHRFWHLQLEGDVANIVSGVLNPSSIREERG